MRKNLRTRAVMLLLGLCLTLTFAACGNSTAQSTEKYTIYFGLNDADTGKQIVTLTEAREKLKAVCIAEGCGFTAQDAYGAYTADDGSVISNDTLVAILMMTDEETAMRVAETVKKELNLSSVLCEHTTVAYQFA